MKPFFAIGLRAFIERQEGLRLAAYQDTGGVWTLGYGHTPARAGQIITLTQAHALLDSDITTAARAVADLVQVPLTLGRRGALIDFVFNLGEAALRTSTLLHLLNGGDYAGACAQFDRWDHCVVDGRMIADPGLLRRREDEQWCWNHGFFRNP